MPSSCDPVVSRFDSTGTQYYSSCVRDALNRGAVCVGSRGTVALFCPSTQSRIGEEERWGGMIHEADGILVVKTSDPGRIHARPMRSSAYSGAACGFCKGPLFPRSV